MIDEVTLLDCTLRDGSYVNNFQFSTYDTEFLCRKLEGAGIKHIEIGHGLGLGAYRKGGKLAAAATDEEYLKAAAETLKSASFGMFCIPGFASLDDIDLAHDHGMDFIRIGTNATEVERSEKFVERAKKHGMLVCSNYMKSYAISPKEFAENAKLSKSYGVDVVYVVDSAGGMLPDELKAYIGAVKDAVDIHIGFHGHNNLDLAVALSLLAVEMGATVIDASLQGLGRGAGNAATEQIAILFSRMGVDLGVDLFKALDVGFDTVQPMLFQTGLNPIDLVSGLALFHSSYMPLIREYSNKYHVDPRELIIKLCERDKVNPPPELVEEVAKTLKPKQRDVFFAKYHLERYFVNEEQLPRRGPNTNE